MPPAIKGTTHGSLARAKASDTLQAELLLLRFGIFSTFFFFFKTFPSCGARNKGSPRIEAGGCVPARVKIVGLINHEHADGEGKKNEMEELPPPSPSPSPRPRRSVGRPYTLMNTNSKKETNAGINSLALPCVSFGIFTSRTPAVMAQPVFPFPVKAHVIDCLEARDAGS